MNREWIGAFGLGFTRTIQVLGGCQESELQCRPAVLCKHQHNLKLTEPPASWSWMSIVNVLWPVLLSCHVISDQNLPNSNGLNLAVPFCKF